MEATTLNIGETANCDTLKHINSSLINAKTSKSIQPNFLLQVLSVCVTNNLTVCLNAMTTSPQIIECATDSINLHESVVTSILTISDDNDSTHLTKSMSNRMSKIFPLLTNLIDHVIKILQ